MGGGGGEGRGRWRERGGELSDVFPGFLIVGVTKVEAETCAGGICGSTRRGQADDDTLAAHMFSGRAPTSRARAILTKPFVPCRCFVSFFKSFDSFQLFRP